MAQFSRKTLLSIRIASIFTSIVSLALFTAFQIHLKSYYDSYLLGVSALPIIGLTITTIWNILVVVLTFTQRNISSGVCLSLDLTSSVILIILGAYGFYHNVYNYLQLGSSLQWNFSLEVGSGWEGEQIVAIVLLSISVILHLVVAILSFWGRDSYSGPGSFWRRGGSTRVDRGLTPTDLPTYEESVPNTEEDFDEAHGHHDMPPGSIKDEKKDKSAESYA